MNLALKRLALALAVSTLAAGSASAQGHLRVGLAEEADTLDPTLARTYVGRIVFAAVCDKLFDIDDKLNVVPQLALAHETSADGKQMTIKLRPGVKFHDGEAFNAEAAKYSLERHRSMKGSLRKTELSPVDRIEIVDPLTIRLVLKEPFSPLLSQLTDRAGMMVSPKAAEAAGDKFGLRPVCAGPFRFTQDVQQDRIAVEKFADYWNKDQVFIDKVTFLPIVDGSVRLASLRAGGLDMIERVPTSDIKALRNDPKLKLSSAVSLGYMGLTINLANGPKANNPLGKDARVRRALDLAIDRDGLNRTVFNGEYVPGNQWINPTNYYYQQAFPVPKRDVARAKALLQEAGVNGPIAVDFLVSNRQEIRAVAEVLRTMAGEAGFDLRIRVTEFTTSLKQAEGGDFQLFLGNWSGRSDPDGNSYTFQACNGPLNNGRYCDKEVDAAHAEARTISDPAQRKKAYETVARKFLPDGDILYLYHPQMLVALSDRVDGYRQMPDGLVRVVGVKLK